MSSQCGRHIHETFSEGKYVFHQTFDCCPDYNYFLKIEKGLGLRRIDLIK